MGFQDFVSETEAATLSGVSVATLRRFSEVGYLKVEKDADGVPLFSKSELGAVFGALSPAALAPTNFMPSSFKPASTTTVATVGAPNPSTNPSKSETASSEPTKTGAVTSLFELLGKDKRPLNQQVEKDVVPPAAANSFSSQVSSAAAVAAATSAASTVTTSALAATSEAPAMAPSAPSEVASATEVPAQSPASPAAAPQNLSAEGTGTSAALDEAAATQITQLTALLDDMRSENRKLRTVVDLQEKILTIRENEIRDLKEQRDWLKSRLERLEEKADRDQLLLLSETQTIRRLISLQEPKKSTFRLALDWLGVTSTNQGNANQEGSSTIEVRNSHQQRPGNTNSNFSESSRGNEARKNQDNKGAGRSNREAA